MRYIHYYKQESDFQSEYNGSTYTEPWTSFTDTGIETEHVDYNKSSEPEWDYVDLGLPSGTLWAASNVGASSPEEFGGYYSLGETSEKASYSAATYTYYTGSTTQYSKYNSVDNKTTLDAADDVVTVVMGSNWSSPTVEQINELCSNTTMVQGTLHGVEGLVITSTIPGYSSASLFFPFAGVKDNSSTASWTGETQSGAGVAKACFIRAKNGIYVTGADAGKESHFGWVYGSNYGGVVFGPAVDVGSRWNGISCRGVRSAL